MTRSDILRMAREARIPISSTFQNTEYEYAALEHFAKLILLEQWANLTTASDVREAIEVAVTKERAECAAEADHWQKIGGRTDHKCGEYIAAAIRARSQP